MSQFVRVFTNGKGREAINDGIVRAVRNGSRVLVKAPAAADGGPPSGLEGDAQAVAAWAEALSQEHGFLWRRVGLDVLFDRPGPE